MSERPLLASSRPSSEQSDDLAGADEDDLLNAGRSNGRNFDQPKRFGVGFWREVGLFVWAMIATIAVVIIAVLYTHQGARRHGPDADPALPTGKRNLIFMVSDGMGPTSLSMTRSFMQFRDGAAPDDVLVLDQHLIGSSRTRSSSSLVTDSAAGATAFSCGFKSYNGAISILPDHQPCGTVLEAAKRAGYMTGLVVTTRITDATPACFAAHVNMRSEEDRIAEQEVGQGPLGRVVDLILGGGRCHFLPNTTDGSCRADDQDIVAMAKNNGFAYLDDRPGFDALKGGDAVTLPLLGLVAETDIPYEIDRQHVNDVYPSLDEMARTALAALSKATENREQGFFLMIEGSRIDHAGHGNDPAAQVHEVLAYDKAFASVMDFVDHSEVESMVISTSDHETGGLAAARQLHSSYPEYLWYPGSLANATHSAENLAQSLRQHLSSRRRATSDDLEAFIRKTLVQDGLGITDASAAEIKKLVDQPSQSAYLFADMISRRAQLGWSTHGHSAVDVNIYGTSNSSKIRGNHENTEVGEFLRDYLELDLEPITKELIEKGAALDQLGLSEGSWMGPLPDPAKVLDALDHYHGDF
ncbi:MAG: hypothetical protein M1838_005586 [Thelocarpon superellum]|nr:MAG: hypothetical protein M1838_005586 [Thelocarpon superellum]